MRKEREAHQPLIIHGHEVERVSCFKFLGVYVSDDLTWSHNTTQWVKKEQQLSQKAEEIRHGTKDPQQLLQQQRH